MTSTSLPCLLVSLHALAYIARYASLSAHSYVTSVTFSAQASIILPPIIRADSALSRLVALVRSTSLMAVRARQTAQSSQELPWLRLASTEQIQYPSFSGGQDVRSPNQPLPYQLDDMILQPLVELEALEGEASRHHPTIASRSSACW